MPRARKEYDQTKDRIYGHDQPGYSRQAPSPQRQMRPHSVNAPRGRNFREDWNNQHYQYTKFAGRGQFPPSYNGQGYFHPNFNTNGNPRGHDAHQNGWNCYPPGPAFGNHHQDWHPEFRREPSYRASGLTTFDNNPYPNWHHLPEPLLPHNSVNSQCLAPLGFDPAFNRIQKTVRTGQDNAGKVNTQPDDITPESQSTESKFDIAQARSETKTSSGIKENLKIHKTDQDLKAADHKNLADRKIDIQPIMDKDPKLDSLENTDRADRVPCPDSTTPEADLKMSIIEKQDETVNESKNEVQVIDLTTDNDSFEMAAQVESSTDVVRCKRDCALPLKSKLGHSCEPTIVLFDISKNIKAETKAATPQTGNKKGASADPVKSLPLIVPPQEDKNNKSSSNLTANTEIVQVAPRGYCLDNDTSERRRECSEDYSELHETTRKEDHRRKEDRKKSAAPKRTEKYVVEDVDMRVLSSTSLYISQPKYQKGKEKNYQLSPKVHSSKLSSTGQVKGNSSKISAQALSPKERKHSMDETSVPHVAATVHQEATGVDGVYTRNNTKRRMSSTSSDASESKRSKLQVLLSSEKDAHSKKKSSKSCNETISGIASNSDETTCSIKITTSGELQSDKSTTNSFFTSLKEKMNQERKLEAKRSSRKSESTSDKVVDDRLVNGAHKGSASAKNSDGECSTDSKSDKNKSDTQERTSKVKLRKDSTSSSSGKSDKHHSSRKGSESEGTVKVAASSSEHKINDKKQATHKPAVKPPVELPKNKIKNNVKKNMEKSSTVEINQNPLSNEKDSVKRKSSASKKLKLHTPKKPKTVIGEPESNSNAADEKVETTSKEHTPPTPSNEPKNSSKKKSDPVIESSPVGNVSKAAGQSEKVPIKPIYKMTQKEWKQLGRPTVDFLRAYQTKVELSKPTLEVNLTQKPVPEVSNAAASSVSAELEKLPEQQDASCEINIGSAETVQPQVVFGDSTDLTESNIDASVIDRNEIEGKHSIKKFVGCVDNISEAHIRVVTICAEEDVSQPILPIGITSTVVSECSGIEPKTIPDSDLSTLNVKEEREINIDDSNFLLVKEEFNVGDVRPPSENVELGTPCTSRLESRLLLPFSYNSVSDFPGQHELTKLVEYFIVLNQDLIKFNDSYRIASRLDEIQRKSDERRASRDLSLVIHKMKPIVEELITFIKVSMNSEEDLLEFIYLYKEVLPCEALKLKADTLSRKAIADIFRLIFEGILDDIDVCRPESVIVYNAEQGQILPKSTNLRYESVIRNSSLGN